MLPIDNDSFSVVSNLNNIVLFQSTFFRLREGIQAVGDRDSCSICPHQNPEQKQSHD